jgi:hypothetical protein
LNTKPTSKFGRLRVLHQSCDCFPSVSNNKGLFRCIGATNPLNDGCLNPVQTEFYERNQPSLAAFARI